MTRKRNRNRKRNAASSCNVGSGSRSYRSVTGEVEHEPIPEPSVTVPSPAKVEVRVYNIDSASASGCEWIAGMTGVDIKHSAIVVFGLKYEFSQEGVEVVDVDFSLQKASQIIQMGSTEKTPKELKQEVEELRKDQFSSSKYNSLWNNCHTFTNCLSLFLTGNAIPKFLLDMSKDVSVQTAKIAGATTAVVGGVAYAANALARSFNALPKEKPQPQYSMTNAMGALAIGNLAQSLCSPSMEEPKQQKSIMNANAAPTLGDLAQSFFSPFMEEPKQQKSIMNANAAPTLGDLAQSFFSPPRQIGLGGLLAAGAVGFAAAYLTSNIGEQPKQLQRQWRSDDDSDDDWSV